MGGWGKYDKKETCRREQRPARVALRIQGDKGRAGGAGADVRVETGGRGGYRLMLGYGEGGMREGGGGTHPPLGCSPALGSDGGMRPQEVTNASGWGGREPGEGRDPPGLLSAFRE